MITIKNKRKTIPPRTVIRNIFVGFDKPMEMEMNPNAKFRYVINPARMNDLINSNEITPNKFNDIMPAKIKLIKRVILRKKLLNNSIFPFFYLNKSLF